jgi:hypothetical protein
MSQFAHAKLPLELMERPRSPARPGLADIVRLRIAPATSQGPERFVIWPGAATNEVEVTSSDAPLRQVVLRVREPRRSFEVWVSSQQRATSGVRVLRRTSLGRSEERWTQTSERHFLAGLDESHLFIAQLPRPASTVWSARQVLRGDAVRLAEKGAFEQTLRQGEWFFVSLLPRELARVEWALRRRPKLLRAGLGLAEATALAREGRPHVAEQVCTVRERTYARGAVTHPDHATLTLPQWRRVVLNAERLMPATGLEWVD